MRTISTLKNALGKIILSSSAVDAVVLKFCAVVLIALMTVFVTGCGSGPIHYRGAAVIDDYPSLAPYFDTFHIIGGSSFTLIKDKEGSIQGAVPELCKECKWTVVENSKGSFVTINGYFFRIGTWDDCPAFLQEILSSYRTSLRCTAIFKNKRWEYAFAFAGNETIQNEASSKLREYEEFKTSLRHLTPDLSQYHCAPKDSTLQCQEKKGNAKRYLADLQRRLTGRRIRILYAQLYRTKNEKKITPEGQKLKARNDATMRDFLRKNPLNWDLAFHLGARLDAELSNCERCWKITENQVLRFHVSNKVFNNCSGQGCDRFSNYWIEMTTSKEEALKYNKVDFYTIEGAIGEIAYDPIPEYEVIEIVLSAEGAPQSR